MRNVRKRALSLLCAGVLLTSAFPARAAALPFTMEGILVQGADENLLIDLGDSSIHGEAVIQLTDYMEAIPDAYREDGLILRLDGLEGKDPEAGTWSNLAGGDSVSINRPAEEKVDGEGTNSFTDDALVLSKSKVYLPDRAAAAINGDAYTVEFFVDSQGYSGNDRTYSPLLTVDETEDSWSIFVREPGKTMELKQKGNTRLRVPFASALDAPSAVVFDKSAATETWYLNGAAQGALNNVTQNATAANIILGGRLFDNNGVSNAAYQTEASYHSIRIYDRVLSAEELRSNALLDRSRFLGEEAVLPDVTVNGSPLDESGTTQITLNFVGGVAQLPVNSGTLGTLTMTATVDGSEYPVALKTVTAIEAIEALLAQPIEVTVVDSATQADVHAALEEALREVLAGSYFLTAGGGVVVTGSEERGFRAALTFDNAQKNIDLTATVTRQAATELDALKPYFVTVMQGTFQFESAEAITAEAISQQVSARLAEETVVPSAEWDGAEGCWMLTLTQGEKSAAMPLYINSEVRYDFEDADLLNYCTMRMAGSGYARIHSGVLEVNGTTSNTFENVVFPVWNFDRDFCYEAEVQLKSAVSDSRWMAVSYGLTPVDTQFQYDFWQMAVRQNATASNGIECAHMSGGWNVTHTASYRQALSPAETYRLTILYRDGVIYEYLNEEFLIKSELVPASEVNGKIAFTFDRLNAQIKSLRVTGDLPDLPTEKPLTENGFDADLYEPVTGLVMAPTVIAAGGDSAAKIAAAEGRPATLVRKVAGDLTVADDGENISIMDYMDRLDKKALAGFAIEDAETAAAFAQYAAENELVDVTVFSADGAVLHAACGGVSGIRGVQDFTGGMPETLIDVVFETNRNGARVALLPASAADRETVRYLQARSVTVWAQAESGEMDAVILAGADGIVTADWEAALNAMEAYDPAQQVLTRPTVIVAHRGFHQTAPENSQRAAQEAVQAGADAIECDIHLSSDGYVMVNHDGNTSRLMDQNLNMAASTKAELQALTFQTNAQPGDKIPTLEELFIAADEADPDDDVIHVIEIKSSDPNLIDPMIETIRRCEMEDRVVFISFDDNQIALLREKMPEISVGELNSCTSAGDDLATSMEKLSARLDPLNAFYNCNYGAQTAEMVAAARHRGIFIHPWTVDAQGTFEQEFQDGYHGITSNRVDFAADYLSGLTPGVLAVRTTAGKNGAVEIAAAEERRSGTSAAEQVSFRQLSGNVQVQRDGEGRFWAQKPGSAVIALGASDTLPVLGTQYTVYSAPVALTFTATIPDEPDDPDDSGSGSGSGGGQSGETPAKPTPAPETPAQPEPPTAPVDMDFSDVPETHWAYPVIETLVQLGVVRGTGEGRFSPEAGVTRAEFVTMLARLSGDPLGQGTTVFQDVASDAWYAGAVAWAVEQGITTGTSAAAFDPAAAISRQDMAVMIYRFLGGHGISLEKQGTASQFQDVGELSAYAAEAVEYMRRCGVISGRPDGSFAPLESASRAETCSMLAGIADAVSN